MSRVFVAHDISLGRMVAIKVFSPEIAAEIKTDRFRLEIQLAAKLHHPHIVPLLLAGETGGLLYFTMPYIDGESLRAKILRDGALPIGDAIRLLRHIASALAYAHKQGIVHRDIKPDNVLLAGEFALVTDFGVAKALSASTTADGGPQLTSGGMAIGTPAYMSPEQALADPTIDHRADIYAFGVVAYEVLTGLAPFRAKTPQATLAAHITQAPEPVAEKRPDIPPALASLVMSCLAKSPDDRPQTANELLHLFDALATGGVISPAFTAAPVPPPRRSPRRTLAVAATTALAVLIGWYVLSARAPNVNASTANLSSIAVLPLDNVGGNQADEYFTDGLTDELTSTLAKLPGLRVAARTSAYSFKGKSRDFAEVGRKLKVQAVIEGSVRRDGGRLRVTAQLIDVADGLTLWSDSYDRDSSDVFRVQDEIARAIAAAVRPKLGTQTRTLSAETRGTDNLEAYDDYLRGRHLFNARGADNLRNSIARFDAAIAADPSFARAYAGRATSYALLPEYTDTPPANASLLAMESARQALSLDPSLAEAHTAIGLASVHEWKFQEAEAAYRTALELDPQHATAHQWYGELLYHTNRPDSSLAHIRLSGALDPLAPIHPAALGYTLYLDGQYDAAINVLKQGIEIAPTLGLHRAMIANVYLATGKFTEAAAEIEQAIKLEPELALTQGQLAYAHARNGNTGAATSIVDKLLARRAGRAPAVALAIAYLGLGDNEKALTSLENAVATRDLSLLTGFTILTDPIYNPVRKDPRFEALLGRMNLTAYARSR